MRAPRAAAVVGVALVAVAATVGVIAVHHAAGDPAPVARIFGPAQVTSLPEAFPHVATVNVTVPSDFRAAGVLSDGTLYGTASRGAVTVDPRSGRETLLHRAVSGLRGRFLDANVHWVVGADENPPPDPGYAVCGHVPTDPMCVAAARRNLRSRGSKPDVWCRDLATGRTVDITAELQGYGGTVALTDTAIVWASADPDSAYRQMDGCGGRPRDLATEALPRAPRLPDDAVDAPPPASGLIIHERRSGHTRVLSAARTTDVQLNAYGLVWTPPPAAAAGVRAAVWGGAVRSVPVRGLPGEVSATSAPGYAHATALAVGDRVFVLGDVSEGIGSVLLYDPLSTRAAWMGAGHISTLVPTVMAAGRFVLWGGTLLDLGTPSPPPLPDLQLLTT
jgi:hypothetical protein